MQKYVEKTIMLLVYNRPEKTKKVLQNLQKLHNIKHHTLLVIRQNGSEDVARLVDRIDWIKTHHLVTDYPENLSVKFKINANMRLGITHAFEELQSEYVIIVEDDLLLGYDFLAFCEAMHREYADSQLFRGVNAFSREPFRDANLFHYGKFIFGVGKGWSINRNMWRKLSTRWPMGIDQHFDHLIEPWIRTGFVIMPYCSRSVDIGWGKGSNHTPFEATDEYYVSMKKSWVGDSSFEPMPYVLDDNLPFHWRSDCYRFSLLQSLRERLRLFIERFKNITLAHIKQILKHMRKSENQWPESKS